MNEDNVLNDEEIDPEYFEVNDNLDDTLDLKEILENIKKSGDDDARG